MELLSKSDIDFLESYNYKIDQQEDAVYIHNSNYHIVIGNAILFLVGLAGIPLAIGGHYKVGLLLLLLLTIPIMRLLRNAPRKIQINFVTKQINNIPLNAIAQFRFSSSEAFAHASPFEKGTVEYTLDLEMVKKDRKVIKLLSFVDREERKEGAEKLLKVFNSWLQ